MAPEPVVARGLPPEAVDPAPFRRTLSDLMLERRSPFGTWATDAWLARPGTLVVRFEALVADPARRAGHVVESLALPVVPTGQPPPTLDELHGAWPRFFRRGTVGAWRDEFPPELLGLVWREFGPTMTRLGYA